ncbi:MAG: 50S ribosomal protein L1 [Zestosphaera tikiterensis]|uniref:Large ribosomal subunit protein uL1 n=1 Tax=Zestosphaera tikiterensis TaxID=1973259 RepID=A0A2R7Y765_9CREN|nr:MAG: 50S ribosomal protein L1 [Zestosphaera tikiterensis]
MAVSKEALSDAIRKALKLGKGRKFNQSVELIVVFKGADPKSQEVKFRDLVFLPKGAGKKSKVLVIATGDMLLKARESGVDVLNGDDLKNLSKKDAKKIARKYDIFLVKSDLMSQVGRVLGPSLGPRGKFPIPVPANADIKSLISRYLDSVKVRNKEQAWVGCRIGVESMSVEDLAENAMAVLDFIRSKYTKPLETTKIYVKTAMGPSVEVITA